MPRRKNPTGGAILLCGIPGSGKSGSGKLLAGLMNIPFYDLDEIVAERAGMSIPEIFAEVGETGFRELEADALDDILADDGPKVVALGGGTLESGKAKELIRGKSRALVWLEAYAAEAARRLEAGGMVDEHPLLRGLRGAMLAEALQKLIDKRRADYALSDFTIDTGGRTPAEVASMIARLPLICSAR